MAGRAPGTAINPIVDGARFAVLAARFNEAISEKLLDGALAAFATHGVVRDAVEVHWVPGSFELPQAALALARTGRYAGIVCVGVVIKGETPHFEYLAHAAAQGGQPGRRSGARHAGDGRLAQYHPRAARADARRPARSHGPRSAEKPDAEGSRTMSPLRR